MSRPAQQLDIRMASNHAGARARRIEQDPVIRLPIPPGRLRAQIRTHQLGIALEAQQVVGNLGQALGIAVGRGQPQLTTGRFQQRAGLAARGRTGIEHPLACSCAQQLRCQLGTGILHRQLPRGETGQLGHRTALSSSSAVGHQGSARASMPIPAKAATACSRLSRERSTRRLKGGWALFAINTAARSSGHAAPSASNNQRGCALATRDLYRCSPAAPCARAETGAARRWSTRRRAPAQLARRFNGCKHHGLGSIARILELMGRRDQ